MRPGDGARIETTRPIDAASVLPSTGKIAWNVGRGRDVVPTMTLQRPKKSRGPTTLRDASPTGLLWRRTKVGLLQARRLLTWRMAPERWQRPPVSPLAEYPARRADESRCIYRRELAITRTDAGADLRLERGKLINLGIAAPHFDGLVLGPDRPLSFWRALGRASAARGFQHGMELRGGCIVPTLGGGLCLLSNALFRAACELGWTILQRHGHTVEAVPDERAVWGLDATVFWPHVDLRIAPRSGPATLSVKVVGETLAIEIYAGRDPGLRVALRSVGDVTYQRHGQLMRANRVVRDGYDQVTGELRFSDVVADNRRKLLHEREMRRNCLSCGETDCHARPRDLGLLALGGRQ